MTFMSMAGRFSLGIVVDRFDPRLVTAVSLVSQAAALFTIRQTDTVPVCWPPPPSLAFRSATSSPCRR